MFASQNQNNSSSIQVLQTIRSYKVKVIKRYCCMPIVLISKFTTILKCRVKVDFLFSTARPKIFSSFTNFFVCFRMAQANPIDGGVPDAGNGNDLPVWFIQWLEGRELPSKDPNVSTKFIFLEITHTLTSFKFTIEINAEFQNCKCSLGGGESRIPQRS